jgi:hypothetical protein
MRPHARPMSRELDVGTLYISLHHIVHTMIHSQRDHRVPCGPPVMTPVDSGESLSDYVNTVHSRSEDQPSRTDLELTPYNQLAARLGRLAS